MELFDLKCVICTEPMKVDSQWTRTVLELEFFAIEETNLLYFSTFWKANHSFVNAYFLSG